MQTPRMLNMTAVIFFFYENLCICIYLNTTTFLIRLVYHLHKLKTTPPQHHSVTHFKTSPNKTTKVTSHHHNPFTASGFDTITYKYTVSHIPMQQHPTFTRQI